MAADVSIAPDSSSPCCAELRVKYEKMKKNRNDLKEAVNLYERLMNKIENEKNDLKKAFKEEKKKGNSEREAKDEEITVRKALENELRELKAQVSSLSLETKTLNPSEKTGEEIERLKRLLDEEKKNASEPWNLLKLEKGKVEEERRLLGLEREKANKFEKALDEEKQKASREKRLADAEKAKLEKQKKILEREKRKTIEEKKRADGLMKKLGEERERVKELESKIASQNSQKEKIQIDNLLKKLEEERERNKILETKIPIQNTQKEKIQINNLLKKLEEEREKNKILLTNIASQNTQKGNFSKLEKEREKLKAKIEALKSAQSSGISVNSGNFEVKLLKEKLKFRKEQLKHVKNVLKLEKSKNNLIKQHFGLIKQDFMQLINRFKLIDSHLGIEGTNHSTKVKPGIGLESPVMQKSRKSPSVPKSGTSSESIPTTNGQNIYKKHFTDKTLLQRGPQENLERERERASSVSSPVLQFPKISGNSLQIQKLSGTSFQVQKLSGTSLRTFPDPLKSSRKRKRNNEKSNLDPKKKEKKTKSQNVNKKIQNSDFAEFEKRVRNGGVLKLLEFENQEMERKFKMAIERPLSPNIPQIAPRKIIKDKKAVRKENLMPKLNGFELEIGSHLSEFNSPLDLMEIVTVNEENRSEEKCEGVTEKGDNLEGRIEKCQNLDYLIVFSSLKEESLERVKTLWKKANFDESCENGLCFRVLEITSELLSEERTCVIYSLLASNICGKLIQNAKNITDGDFASYIGSFRDDIYSVISEEVLKLLSENKILQNFIALMEDFINYKKVLVYKNGEFCAETTTKDQIVSNCIILASICLKINRLDITLSFAYKILLEGKTDISHTLLLVHIIKYICGERLFCTDRERFLSRAVRFVLFKLEKIGRSEKLEFFLCENCPFEIDEKSFEGFVDSLLDEVEMCCLIGNPNPNFVCGESCSVYKAEKNGLCYLMEIISLVELVAIYMDWKDMYEKVLLRLLKILESCKNEDYSAALLVLIGHLARFGVEKLGYEHIQISELRQKLSNFMKTNENSAALPLQFASVGVFLSLIPLQFKEVIREDPSLSDKAEFWGIIGQIKSWFSQLSEEQKTVSQSFFMGSEGKEGN